MPALTWPLPAVEPMEWNVTAMRREPAARRDDGADAAGDGRALGDLDEGALVAACVSGRTGAFDLLVERHRRSVYQLCYRFAGNHEDASDLSQEVFLRAFRALHKFRGQASMATWLYRIAVNACLSRVGAKGPLTQAAQPIDDAMIVDVKSESAPDRLLRQERAARVRAAIARLPERQRATLVLRTYQELSHKEIADMLGISVGTVKANFFHALGNLKKLLGESS